MSNLRKTQSYLLFNSRSLLLGINISDTINIDNPSAFTAKEEWTSKAQIIQPNAVQLGNFLEVQQWYSRFSSADSLNVDKFLKNAYNTLIVMLSAADNKLDYLQNSDYFKQQSIKLDSEVAKQKMLVAMSTNNLKIKETEANKRDSFDVSFTAETASNAQKTLQDYIESTNNLVLSKLFEDLRLQINEHIRTLENEANNIRQQTEQDKKNQVMLLEQALVAAKDANIVEYTGESTVAGNTIIDFSNFSSMFLLGEKYLTAQLQSLESSPIIYPVSYYQTLTNISGLKQLLEFKPKGLAFEYTLKPSQPLVKDKPRKSLILIVGALLGAMLGCGVVLVGSAIKKRKTAS